MNGSFTQTTLRNGVNVYVYPTRKFKTYTIRLFIHNPLARRTVTRVALIPAVLKRGCAGLETTKEISRHLDSLYGAHFDAGVFKLGESQVIQMGIELANPRFLGVREDLLARGLDFLRRVLFEPLNDGRSFRGEYVEQEKDVLSREIAAIINEKSRYAIIRCLQEMFSGEPFGIHELGFMEDIPGIDGRGLFELYRDVLDRRPVDVCVVGDVNERSVLDLVEQSFSGAAPRTASMGGTPPAAQPEAPRYVIERQDVNQGKLCLGYACDTGGGDRLYPMMFYDGIFGGFVHSKLFMNVREKASLAYYANSVLNAVKGFLLVTSGIDVDKYDRALEIIRKQADDIQAGDISASEMEFTRKA
ncbi:MAG: EF-P 5-aminopentanol modification-associated protein YfmF, partial [Bacillota bacterium]